MFSLLLKLKHFHLQVSKLVPLVFKKIMKPLNLQRLLSQRVLLPTVLTGSLPDSKIGYITI